MPSRKTVVLALVDIDPVETNVGSILGNNILDRDSAVSSSGQAGVMSVGLIFRLALVLVFLAFAVRQSSVVVEGSRRLIKHQILSISVPMLVTWPVPSHVGHAEAADAEGSQDPINEQRRSKRIAPVTMLLVGAFTMWVGIGLSCWCACHPRANRWAWGVGFALMSFGCFCLLGPFGPLVP